MSDTKALNPLPLDEEKIKKIRMARTERYACQSVARLALPEERVSFCLRRRINVSDVEVWKHRTTRKAFYGGLRVCGSVWNCPVCAGKITERRRAELKSAYDKHLASGGKIAFLTLTFSHKKTDRLDDILQAFQKARRRFFSGKRYQNIKNKIGFIGSITGLEVTYGSNGYHPHVHVLLFYLNQIDLEILQDEFRELWQKACSANDLKTKEKYALTLQNGEQANEYMAKYGAWGLDHELTKANVKKGKKESLTPFDFLRVYLQGQDKLYLKLFAEYAAALKGKQQLIWSPGLKERFSLDEKSDEVLATEKQEEADLLGQLDFPIWKEIVRREKRAYVLDLCESEGFDLQEIKKEFSPTSDQ